MPYNIIILLILGFIFPFSLLTLLVKGKKSNKLNSTLFKKKAGILYMEYRNNTYYWEIINIFTVI